MKKLLLYIICIVFSFNVIGQTSADPDELFNDANTYFNFEDYTEALYLFLDLYKHIEPNAHIDYKIGVCYLQIPGEKQKALPYLVNASKHLTKLFSQYSLIEKKAPYETLFYLGNAYLATNQLDKALEEYKKFEGLINVRKYDLEYLEKQKSICVLSKELQERPVNYLQLNMGMLINNRFDNYNAVISGDGNTLAFTSKLQFYDAIMVSTKNSDGTWKIPMNVTLSLKSDEPMATLCLSFDGKELYLYRDDDHDGNIYISRLGEFEWSAIEPLTNINTKYWEAHASVSNDDQYLFFSSNRPGGEGDLDIYFSKRRADGTWGSAKNAGNKVNSPFHDTSPFLSEDQNVLFFSSQGHNNVGGYDIFYALRDKGDKWNEPENIGYPLNTTDDELFFYPIKSGELGIISKYDERSYGKQDIFQLEIFSNKYLKAILTKDQDQIDPETIADNDLIIDTLNNLNYAVLVPTKETNVYNSITSNYDNYQIYYSGQRYQFVPDTFKRAEEDLIISEKDLDSLYYAELNDSLENYNLSLLTYQKDSSLRGSDLLNSTVKTTDIDLAQYKSKEDSLAKTVDSIQKASLIPLDISEEIASLDDRLDRMRDINMSNAEINNFYQWMLIFSNDSTYLDQLFELKKKFASNNVNYSLIDTIINRLKYIKTHPNTEDSIIQLVLMDYLQLDNAAQKDILELLNKLPEKEYITSAEKDKENTNMEIPEVKKKDLRWINTLILLILAGVSLTLYRRFKSKE